MKSNLQKYSIISSSLFISWIFFEYWFDLYSRNKLKEILKKNIKSIYSLKYSLFYQKSISGIFKEINDSQDLLRNHIETSMKKTFSSISSFGSLKDKLIKYHDNKKEMNIKNILKIENMSWYPFCFRIIFSCVNGYFLLSCRLKYKFNQHIFRNNYIYTIEPKNKPFEKVIVIFPGLGGILSQFNKLIEILINKNYKIIIPMYGPCQASLKYNFDCHECQFYNDIHDFLLNNGMCNVDIIAWSLGGILYKGFEKYNSSYFMKINQDIKINKIILFEPLLGMRACIDTYFSKLRNRNKTLSIFNCVTSKKYGIHNNIFSYFIHSIVGFSTANSFGFFTSTELTESYYNPKRYIFISSEDVIINEHLDKELLKYNFDKNNVFKRNGYHGGWLQSNKLKETISFIL